VRHQSELSNRSPAPLGLTLNPRIKSGLPGRSGRSTCADVTRGRTESTHCTGMRSALVPRVVPRHPRPSPQDASLYVMETVLGERAPSRSGRPRGRVPGCRRPSISGRSGQLMPRRWSPGAEGTYAVAEPMTGAPAPGAAARGASGNGTHRSAVNGHGEAGQAGSSRLSRSACSWLWCTGHPSYR
jgi:hypothetical protein